MSWEDRISEAAYTSPSGVRIVFQFTDVSVSADKKTAAFEFPDANGTYVQDSGHTGRRFPLTIYFNGADYDTESDAFFDLLLESGVGKLEHPIYGQYDVVPTGKIERKDALVTGANQAIFTIEFWQTIRMVYPASNSDPASDIQLGLSSFSDAAATEFTEQTSLGTAVEKARFTSVFRVLLGGADNVLGPIAKTSPTIFTQYNNIKDSIEQSLDTLIDDPLTLAKQTVAFLQTPALVLRDDQKSTNIYANVVQRLVSTKENIINSGNATTQTTLAGYGEIITFLTEGDNATTEPGYDSQNKNNFQARKLFADGSLASIIVAQTNSRFQTKSDTIDSIEFLQEQFALVSEWSDNNYESLNP